jgi:hypothetical protein
MFFFFFVLTKRKKKARTTFFGYDTLIFQHSFFFLTEQNLHKAIKERKIYKKKENYVDDDVKGMRKTEKKEHTSYTL